MKSVTHVVGVKVVHAHFDVEAKRMNALWEHRLFTNAVKRFLKRFSSEARGESTFMRISLGRCKVVNVTFNLTKDALDIIRRGLTKYALPTGDAYRIISDEPRRFPSAKSWSSGPFSTFIIRNVSPIGIVVMLGNFILSWSASVVSSGT